jgi:hypothetical protein
VSRIDDLAYQCRKCKKKCVGFGNVVLQEIVFRTTHEGKKMLATVIWCPQHAPREEAA